MAAVDVLLGHALFMDLDPKQSAKSKPYPPLATLYMAALLRQAGYQVAVFDAMLAPDEGAFREALARHRPRLVVMFEDNFNFLSKMCLARMRQAALAMIRMAAVDGVPVVAAGSDATDEPGEFLAAGALAVALGEGDHTVAEVVATVLGPPSSDSGVPQRFPGPDGRPIRERLCGIAGLALADGNRVLRTAVRPPERRPDVFPLPARDLVDLEAYRKVWYQAHGYFSINMAATRGCPFHCNWCAKPIWGQRYAMRTPRAVAEEMAELKRTIAPDHVWFADDIFGLRPDWTAEFGQEVARLNAQIPFQIQSRVDLMSEAAVEGLSRAGCTEVWLGVESGSQRILDAMEKGIQVADVPAAVERLQRVGIRVCFFLQFGYPGETWADIKATAALVRRLLPDEIGISVSYPLPGTRFYEWVAAELGEERHWHDSKDLAMLFQGSYPSDFYRRLHGLLHRELDLRHALDRFDSSPGGVESVDHIANSPGCVESDATASNRTASGGTADRAGLERDLALVMREWQELAAVEPELRTAAPTHISPPGVTRPAPDLSRAAN